MTQNDERERLTGQLLTLAGIYPGSWIGETALKSATKHESDAAEIAELRKNAFGWRFDLFDEAWHEAYKRYPGAEGALIFLRTAIGPTQTPNEADLKWAETALAAHTEGMKGKEK